MRDTAVYRLHTVVAGRKRHKAEIRDQKVAKKSDPRTEHDTVGEECWPKHTE